VGTLVVLYFVDPFIGDWDGLDYTMLSIAGYPSSMALGRNLFIFENHFLYQLTHRLFNVPLEDSYLVFKYAVVAQAPLALIGCWVLARDVSRSLHTATLATVMIALSPVFVLYSGQVMTDVPSMLVLTVALIIHLRGVQRDSLALILLGAALLGFGMNLRETFAFYVPWLVLAPFFFGRERPRSRILTTVLLSCLVFLICGLSWFAYWFITDPHYRWIWFGWRESMAQESARHPITLRNLWPYIMYFFISAPLAFLALPFAIRNEKRLNGTSPLLLLGVIGLFANLVLFLNYSTSVNWRYFLTGLPAFVPLSAHFLLRKLGPRLRGTNYALAACIGAVCVFAIVFGIYIRPVSREYIVRRALSKQYRFQLQRVPRDAIMISGSQTIAVTYWKAMGLGDWKTIGTGGGWPGDRLVPQIEEYLIAGKRVFLDTDPRWWLPCGWQRDEIAAIVDLQNRFSFRRLTDTIYEVRPLSDPTAQDVPDLRRLLPENRPQDMKKCTPGRA
jgi:dolichyl-phosphate-mannose-protein mannosyltransferase